MFIELQHTFAFICKPSTSPCFTSLTAMTPWYSRYIFNWVPGLLGKKIQNLWSLAKVWDYMTRWKKKKILRLDEEFARPALSCGGTIWLSFLSSFIAGRAFLMFDIMPVWRSPQHKFCNQQSASCGELFHLWYLWRIYTKLSLGAVLILSNRIMQRVDVLVTGLLLK